MNEKIQQPLYLICKNTSSIRFETIIDDHTFVRIVCEFHGVKLIVQVQIIQCALRYVRKMFTRCMGLISLLFCWWLNNECLDRRTMVNAIRAAIIVSFNEQFMCFNCFEGWWTWLWNDSLMKRIRLVCFILWTIVGKKSRVELEGCRWNEKIKRWNRQGIRINVCKWSFISLRARLSNWNMIVYDTRYFSILDFLTYINNIIYLEFWNLKRGNKIFYE